jgi:hypothetical protein
VTEAAVNVTLQATRTGGADGAVGISVNTLNGSALAGHDYVTNSGSLSWADTVGGTKNFTVTLINSGDAPCTNRAFSVNLSAATGGATLGTPTNATVTIIMDCPPPIPPDPSPPGVLAFASTSFPTQETAGSVVITVQRLSGTNGVASVAYATSNGSAVAGTDYTATSGILNWAAGDATVKTFAVTIINSGTVAVVPRTFGVALSGAAGAALGSPAFATVPIAMNAPLTISARIANANLGSATIGGP